MTVLFLLHRYFNSQCSAVNHPSRMASRGPMYLSVSILLLLPTALPFCAAQNTYYVMPTPDTPCLGDPCHTLTEYVNQSEQYLTSNTTMILLPGEHALQDNITVRNIGRLVFIGNPSSSPTEVSRIICTDATFTFENILMLEITDLGFHSCTIQLDTSSVVFKNNSFHNSISKYGGAIYTHNSVITFDGETRFENNRAARDGGGIYAEESNLTFHGNTTFINNEALEGGGGIFVSGSNVSFGDNTSFISNSVEGDGGGVNVWESTMSFGDNSSFIGNSAEFGGGIIVRGSTVSFGDGSSFIGNSAEVVGGGVSVWSESTVSFGDNIRFISNSAEDVVGGVYLWESNVSFGDNSSFISNSAELGGGVILGESTVSFGDGNSFLSNSAKVGGGVVVLDSTVSFGDNSSFISNSAEGDGGGLYVLESTVSFGDSSSFISNSAEGSGGGVIVWESNVSFGDNTSFISNSVEYDGGGVNIRESNVSFGDDSSFLGNSAGWGGGVSILLRSYVRFGNESDFTENQASYFGGCVNVEVSTLEFGSRSDFMNNSAWYGGCFFMERCNISFSIASTFLGNSAITCNVYNGGSSDGCVWGYGGAIVGSRSNFIFAEIQGLTDNSAGYGGAIYLNHDSKIYLRQSTSVYFKTNFAQYRGGALFVEDNPFTHCILDSGAQEAVQDACFIQMHKYQGYCTPRFERSPEYFDRSIDLQFQDNTAKETGSILYGGNLDSCGLCFTAFEYFPGGVAFNMWANASNNSLISSDPYLVCLCVDNKPDCNQSKKSCEVFPGSTLLVPVVALGQRDGIVPGVIQTYPSDGIALDDLQTTQHTNNTCTNLQYTVRTTSGIDVSSEATLTLYVDEPCSLGGFHLELLVMFKICPPGFTLSNEETCQCEQRLKKYEVECDINDQSILRRGSVWIGLDERSDNQSQGLILHPHCPFDYCKPETDSVNFTLNNTDLQCNNNRSGHLCGACTYGYSLAVGSSRCLSCSNKFLALLIPFIFAGLVLVAFLFICKVTVSAGTISGLIFYANFVTANQSAFFPTIGTNVLTVFIAWLNLDVGFETCLYDGMDVYSKTWLQFVFPLYIWLLVGVIIVICNVSTTAARFIGSTNPIAVLATLFLLSYTKLLRTFIAAFSFTTLAYPDDNTKVVWLYDGNIGYLDENDGRHIALFLAGFLAFLFLFLPYTIFLLFGQCILPRLDLNKLRWLSWANYTRIKSFLDAYHAPYKDRHRYWIGLLLLIRFILFLISAIVDIKSPQDQDVNLLVIIIASTSLSVWVWNASGGVYKKWYLNVLESSFILNLTFFAAATLYVKLVGGKQYAIFYTSVTVAFSTFIGIIIYHVFQCLRDSRVWRNIVRKHNEGRRAGDTVWQSVGAPKEILPRVAPTVTYFDIPTEERREMCPITPPQSPANVIDTYEPFHTSQKEDATGDKKLEEIIQQVGTTAMHVDIPADERNMCPIIPPQQPTNFTDLREPLNLLTE